jgi:hypothetical protein
MLVKVRKFILQKTKRGKNIFERTAGYKKILLGSVIKKFTSVPVLEF